MLHFSRSVTINRPRLDVYQLWRQLDRLPEFMLHLESVSVVSESRSHWVAKAPAGQQVEWDAEITDDQPGDLIAWRSLQGSDVPNGGSVRFIDAPADRGTELHVDLYYEPVGGKAGSTFAKLFGEEPSLQLRDDLRRFKQVMETGEVVRSDGSLEGAGEGASKERPAQAPKGKVGVRS